MLSLKCSRTPKPLATCMSQSPTPMNELARLSSSDIVQRGLGAATLVLPLGSVEQHGPHLPVSVDSLIGVHLARALAHARPASVVLAPLMPYGSSGEHAGFAGTISIGQEALELMLVEFCRSATETFSSVFVVSGHGGNRDPLSRAANRMLGESRSVHWWSATYRGDAHAGHSETSMLLHLAPDRVEPSRSEAGNTRPLADLMGQMRSGGVRAVSRNGVLGDPTTASAGDGATLLREMTATLLEEFDRWSSARQASED